MIRYFFFFEIERGESGYGVKEVKCPGCAKKKVSKEGFDRRGGGKMLRYMNNSIGHGGFGFTKWRRWDSSLTEQ